MEPRAVKPRTSSSDIPAGGVKTSPAPFFRLGQRLGNSGTVLLLGLLLTIGGVLWVKVLIPYTPIAPIPCPFERVTGYDCPGCGLQSSLSNLVALRWKYVLMANILSPILLPLFFVLVISWAADYFFGRTVWKFDPPWWVVVGGSVVVLLYGVLRNIPALGIW